MTSGGQVRALWQPPAGLSTAGTPIASFSAGRYVPGSPGTSSREMHMRHTITTIIVAAVLALASPAARAQEMTEARFVALAAMGGLAEVRLGRLASERAGRAGVQQFAERMVTDHGAMNAELARLAARKGMSVPLELDDRHQQEVDRLARLSG